MPGKGGPIAGLRGLLDRAAAGEADPIAVADAAGAVFAALRRTDMRSGVANIVRRLAQLDASGDQPIPPEGWALLRDAAVLLDRPTVVPADVQRLDERLQELGLDVDFRPGSAPHQPGETNPN